MYHYFDIFIPQPDRLESQYVHLPPFFRVFFSRFVGFRLSAEWLTSSFLIKPSRACLDFLPLNTVKTNRIIKVTDLV